MHIFKATSDSALHIISAQYIFANLKYEGINEWTGILYMRLGIFTASYERFFFSNASSWKESCVCAATHELYMGIISW